MTIVTICDTPTADVESPAADVWDGWLQVPQTGRFHSSC